RSTCCAASGGCPSTAARGNAAARPCDMISLQSIAGGKRAVLLLLLFLVVALLLLPESRQESLMVIGRPMATVIAVPLRGMEAANQTIDSLVNRYLALQHMREENLALRQH